MGMTEPSPSLFRPPPPLEPPAMVCVIAREEKRRWNRPTFKGPWLELKPIRSARHGHGSRSLV